MGNSVGVESNPCSFEEFFTHVQNASPHETPPEPCPEPTYQSILKTWRFYQTETEQIHSNSEPLTEFSKFHSNSCYIVLHLYLQDRTNVKSPKSKQKKKKSESAETLTKLFDIIESAREQLTPRGQSIAIGGYSSQSFQHLNSTGPVDYDIYLWNGKDSCQQLKSQILNQVFEVDSCLKTKGISKEELLLFFTEPPTVISWFSTSKAGSAHWKLLAKGNHLCSSLYRNYAPKRDSLILSDNNLLPNSTRSVSTPLARRPKTETHKKNIANGRKPSKLVAASLSLNLPPPEQADRKLLLDLSSVRSEDDFYVPPVLESKALKIARYDSICSKITENLYLGGDTIARNLDILKQTGITHILNCAGTACQEYHPSEFIYKTLFLYDATSENISCLFYEVLDFLHSAISDGGKVYVHCHQGISRSTAMVVLYLMWKNHQPFQITHEQVKTIREIANPNAGFTCQLLSYWHHHSVPLVKGKYRMFTVAPHCKTTLQLFALREISHPSVSMLDPRICFIVLSYSRVFIWFGVDCNPCIEPQAMIYVRRLQQFENAPKKVRYEQQGSESKSFLRVFKVASIEPVPNCDFDSLHELLQLCFPEMVSTKPPRPKRHRLRSRSQNS